MPRFQFQTPQGNYEVEAPDQSAAINAIQGMLQPTERKPWEDYQGRKPWEDYRPTPKFKLTPVEDDGLSLEQKRAMAEAEARARQAADQAGDPVGSFSLSNPPSTFIVTSPEGKKYKVTGNGTAEEALQQARQRAEQASVDDAAARAKAGIARAQGGAWSRPPNSLAPGASVHSEFDPARVPSQTPMLDKVGAFSMSGLEGIPVAGPSFKNVALDIAAGLGSLSGQPFDKVRSEMEANAARAQEQNPGTSFLGTATGTIGPMIGLGATELGAKALGITGDSLLGRILAGGISNAAIGGADTAARGGSLSDAGKSALISGGIGMAIPGVGSLVNALGRSAGEAIGPRLNALLNPESEAAKRVGRTMLADRNNLGAPVLSQQDELSALINGQPILNVDRGGEGTRALMRSAANNDPEARATIDRAVSDRFASQGPRAVGFIDRLMGGNADDLALQDSLKAAARKANGPAYRKAYRDGANGIITPELERLAGSPAVADAMKAAARNGQNRAISEGFGAFNPRVTFTPDGRVTFRNSGGVAAYPDLQLWDYTKRELDDMASAARRAGRNGEAGTLENLASTLRGELDKAVPSYAQARQGAASFFGAEDALDAGRKFVSLSRSIPETRQALAKMTPAERDAFATGFASELKDAIGTMRDRSNVIDRIWGTPESRQKIELALGPAKAAQFEAFARVETIMDKLRGAMGNSTTARQLKELGMATAAGTGAGYVTGDWKAGLTTGLLVRGARAYGAKVDEGMAKSIAAMLLSENPQNIRMAISAASRSPRGMETLTAMQKFLASATMGAGLAGSRAPAQP
ncbi:MAG: hypothetical protein E5X48_11210 [Mesorhizobium sp.]|uniref:hypothetical protein n=1 Tax=Mesorhizobium sp. TaxID=1871066 RepID=UPI00121F088A|nr:hypothetical protein [Mesorhizobium sp.]TIQ35986.1 MAG: hypothetical protein E5X48_11210 [Mesorhizobium sp.]